MPDRPRGAPTPRLQHRRDEVPGRTPAGDKRLQRHRGPARGGSRREVPLEGRHEGRTPEHPLVRRIVLAASPEGVDCGPPSETPDEASALELRAPPLRDPGTHEGAVRQPCPRGPRGKPAQDAARVLPRTPAAAEQHRMPRVRIPVQRAEVRDPVRAEGIQMDIPHQLQEVRLRLHHDRRVPVLEEMPPPPVAPVEATA